MDRLPPTGEGPSSGTGLSNGTSAATETSPAHLGRKLEVPSLAGAALVDGLMMLKRTPCDLVLIHPPHVVDPGHYPLLPMPWNHRAVGCSTAIGSTLMGPTWNIRPMGFATMQLYLHRCGYSCRILNFAGLTACNFSERSVAKPWPAYFHGESGNEELIAFALSQLRARVVGVDLHWLVHCQGAVRVLEWVKRLHPETHTVIGGLSASVFGADLLREFAFIDFVVVGDGCVPVRSLLEQLAGHRRFSQVPNLLYREHGEVRSGRREVLSDWAIAQDADTGDTVPLSRGCPVTCVACGGSRAVDRRLFGHDVPHVYSVEKIVEKMAQRVSHYPGRMYYLVHDPLLTLGRKNWHELLRQLKRHLPAQRYVIEVFEPLGPAEIRRIATMVPGSELHYSPESMDERVRRRHRGLRYSNAALLRDWETVNATADLSQTLWFLAGVAGDCRSSIDTTLAFSAEFAPKLRRPGSFIKYDSMNFIDPGSVAWEAPSRFGYRLLSRSPRWYVEQFAGPTMKSHINYEMEGLSRSGVFQLFLYVHDRIAGIYRSSGAIHEEEWKLAVTYNRLLRDYEPAYDAACSMSDPAQRHARLRQLGRQVAEELAGRGARAKENGSEVAGVSGCTARSGGSNGRPRGA